MAANREARKRAMGRVLSLASQAFGERLKAVKAPKAAPIEVKPEAPKDDGIEDDDARRLIELYEAKQSATPEA